MPGLGTRMDQGKGGSGSKTFLKHFRNSKSTIKLFLCHIYLVKFLAHRKCSISMCSKN